MMGAPFVARRRRPEDDMGKRSLDQSATQSKVFCMMPWVSLHVAMNGNAYPCCFAPGDMTIGSVREQTVDEIWNSERLRALRVAMLEGRESAICAKCYEQEESGFSSLRTSANANYPHHREVVGETLEDGRLERRNCVYLDFRFSNVCNFACRTCGPIASTAWAKYAEVEGNPILRPRESLASLLAELEPFVERLEQAYFAGGEPLLTEEHYRILEMLLAHGRSDVLLSYSTNYSVFEFRQWKALELWRRFPRVDVAASLDGNYERAEYIRRGQKWGRLLENRQRQLRECPHVGFSVASTLSVLNALHLPDFHEEWIEAGLVEPGRIHINILQEPQHFRITTFPAALKAKVRRRYERHLEFLARYPGSEPAMRGYRAAIHFLYAQDTTSELAHLRSTLTAQDEARRESFEATFPELEELFAGS